MSNIVRALSKNRHAYKFSRNAFYFSSNQPNPQIIEQIGYLSSLLIEKISTIRPTQDILSSSLSQALIKLVNDQRKIVSPESCEQINKMFTEGIFIDRTIFNQIRHNRYEKKTHKGTQLNITYFPTSLTTGQIFRSLLDLQSYDLFLGHSGIAKTIALQLYWILSNNISKCKFQKTIHNPKLYQKIKSYPKLWYWNISQYDTIQSVRNKILLQCSQIGSLQQLQNKYHLLDLNKMSKTIKDIFNQHDVPTIIGVDQINIYANTVRDQIKIKYDQQLIYNPLIQKRQQYGINSLSPSEIKKLEEYENPVSIKDRIANMRQRITYQYIFKTLAMQFNRYALFTSINIQQNIFPNLKVMTNKHNPLNQKRIAYTELMDLDSTIQELIDFFLFELQSVMNIAIFQKQSKYFTEYKKQIRNKLFKQISTKSKQYILTPLTISNFIKDKNVQIKEDFLRQNTQKNKILNIDNTKKNELTLQQIYSIIQKWVEKAIQESKLELGNSFLNFLNKVDTQAQKIKFINEILFSQFKRKVKSKPLKRYQIDFSVVRDGINKFKSSVDKNLFYQDKRGKTYSLLPKRLLINIIGPEDRKKAFLYMLNNYSRDAIYNFYKSDQQGRYFQQVFIDTLSLGNVEISFKSIKEQMFLPIYAKRFGFTPLPSDSTQLKSFDFLNSFQPFLNQMGTKKIKTALFVPLKKDYQNQKFINSVLKNQVSIDKDFIDWYSRCIDFALVVAPPTTNDSVRLFAFDLTISKSVQSKIINFINAYLELKNPFQNKINWNGEIRKIQLNFYVISSKQKQKHILQNVRKHFQNQLQFEVSDPKYPNMLRIKKVKGSSEFVINYVGYVYMGKQDMKISVEGNRNINIYDKLMEVIEKEQKNR